MPRKPGTTPLKYVQVDTDLPESRKTKRLAEAMDIPIHEAVGFQAMLFVWTFKHLTDDVTELYESDLECAMAFYLAAGLPLSGEIRERVKVLRESFLKSGVVYSRKTRKKTVYKHKNSRVNEAISARKRESVKKGNQRGNYVVPRDNGGDNAGTTTGTPQGRPYNRSIKFKSTPTPPTPPRGGGVDSRKSDLDTAIQDFTRRMTDAGHGDDSQSSAAKALADAVAAHGDTPGAVAAMVHAVNETIRKTDFDWSGPNPARYPLVVFGKAAKRNFEPPKPSYRGSRTATSGVLESPDAYGAMPKGVAGVGDA